MADAPSAGGPRTPAELRKPPETVAEVVSWADRRFRELESDRAGFENWVRTRLAKLEAEIKAVEEEGKGASFDGRVRFLEHAIAELREEMDFGPPLSADEVPTK